MRCANVVAVKLREGGDGKGPLLPVEAQPHIPAVIEGAAAQHHLRLREGLNHHMPARKGEGGVAQQRLRGRGVSHGGKRLR